MVIHSRFSLTNMVIHSRFSNNRVKYFSAWKIFSSEFLLLNKNKNHKNICKIYKNTNLVIIPAGVFFLILILEPQQELNFSWDESQSGWTGEKHKDEYDKIKLPWFTSQLNNRYLCMIRYKIF